LRHKAPIEMKLAFGSSNKISRGEMNDGIGSWGEGS
jgi:hypothetical protein